MKMKTLNLGIYLVLSSTFHYFRRTHYFVSCLCVQIFYLATELSQDLDPEDKVEEELEVVPASYTAYSLVFLDKYTQYRIQILAFNPAGDGPRSQPVTVKTLQVMFIAQHKIVKYFKKFVSLG